MKKLPTFEEFVNESYKRPSATTKIAGEYQISWGKYPAMEVKK